MSQHNQIEDVISALVVKTRLTLQEVGIPVSDVIEETHQMKIVDHLATVAIFSVRSALSARREMKVIGAVQLILLRKKAVSLHQSQAEDLKSLVKWFQPKQSK